LASRVIKFHISLPETEPTSVKRPFDVSVDQIVEPGEDRAANKTIKERPDSSDETPNQR